MAKKKLTRLPDLDDKVLIRDETFNDWFPSTVIEADDEEQHMYTRDGRIHLYSEYPKFWKYADEA
jgi:hypothetical protein